MKLTNIVNEIKIRNANVSPDLTKLLEEFVMFTEEIYRWEYYLMDWRDGSMPPEALEGSEKYVSLKDNINIGMLSQGFTDLSDKHSYPYLYIIEGEDGEFLTVNPTFPIDKKLFD